MSNLEWDVYMAILCDRSDDPSVWARKKLQQMADRIHALTAERDEARRMWCEAEAVGNCLSVDDMYRRARAEAKRREWDCYKEDDK